MTDTWIDRLPRPERSGAWGIFFALFTLWQIITPSAVGSAECGIMPWTCHETEQRQEELEPRWRPLTYLVPGKGTADDECDCHIDIHRWGKPIEHATWLPQICDNTWIPYEWTPATWKSFGGTIGRFEVVHYYVIYVTREGRGGTITETHLEPGEGEYRMHRVVRKCNQGFGGFDGLVLLPEK